MKKHKKWYGPAYLLEGFMFATGCFTKNFALTTGSVIAAFVTATADTRNRRADIRDAYERGKIEAIEIV